MSPPDTNADLPQWLAYLESLHPTEIDLGLERVRVVAAALELAYPYTVITVGGTNGKGSVCAMLEAMLLAGGYKAGVYTSPHLIDYNERIRINGTPASDEQIVKQFQRIEAARGDVSLTYFEFGTLAALCLFQLAGIDVAILEVGLGGRLDAVNLVDADCAIITSVDIDHSAYLGNTREQIGLEKAHIFRPGRPAICADPQPPETLVAHARSIGADLWLFGQDFNYSGDRLQWAYGGRQQRRSALAYPALRGANQLLNASAALAALEALRDTIVLPQHAVRLGLSHAALPGRFQILPGQPAIILDVAHNPHAAAALGLNIAAMPNTGKTYAVAGMFRDKDVSGVLSKIIPYVDYWLCASIDGARGLSGAALAERVRSTREAMLADPSLMAGLTVSVSSGFPVPAGSPSHDDDAGDKPRVRPATRELPFKTDAAIVACADPASAFEAARQRASPDDRILVFGSFATVGPVLHALGRKAS